MEAIIVYDNKLDRELLELVDSKFSIFIRYINSIKNKSEANKIKYYWGAIANPFIELKDGDKTIKVFYSDTKGDNAIYQLINYLNERKN